MSHSDLLLIFAYNADRGFFKAIKDVIKKGVSPSTYRCGSAPSRMGWPP
jgi:hypothetical protein